MLELEFLFRMRFNLYIHTHEYNDCIALLYARTAPVGRAAPPAPAQWHPAASSAHFADRSDVAPSSSSSSSSAAAAAATAEDSDLSRVSTPCATSEIPSWRPVDRRHSRDDHQPAEAASGCQPDSKMGRRPRARARRQWRRRARAWVARVTARRRRHERAAPLAAGCLSDRRELGAHLPRPANF